MTTTYAVPAARRSKVESGVLRRARQERLRQLTARDGAIEVAPAPYEPRHRADVPVDSAA